MTIPVVASILWAYYREGRKYPVVAGDIRGLRDMTHRFNRILFWNFVKVAYIGYALSEYWWSSISVIQWILVGLFAATVWTDHEAMYRWLHGNRDPYDWF